MSPSRPELSSIARCVRTRPACSSAPPSRTPRPAPRSRPTTCAHAAAALSGLEPAFWRRRRRDGPRAAVRGRRSGGGRRGGSCGRRTGWWVGRLGTQGPDPAVTRRRWAADGTAGAPPDEKRCVACCGTAHRALAPLTRAAGSRSRALIHPYGIKAGGAYFNRIGGLWRTLPSRRPAARLPAPHPTHMRQVEELKAAQDPASPNKQTSSVAPHPGPDAGADEQV